MSINDWLSYWSCTSLTTPLQNGCAYYNEILLHCSYVKIFFWYNLQVETHCLKFDWQGDKSYEKESQGILGITKR